MGRRIIEICKESGVFGDEFGLAYGSSFSGRRGGRKDGE